MNKNRPLSPFTFVPSHLLQIYINLLNAAIRKGTSDGRLL